MVRGRKNIISDAKKILLLTAVLECSAAVACTSFAIHPSVSETGRMLLQKCRDSTMGKLDADIRTAKNGRRWMRIGANGGTMFAMNDRGVAVTVNTGNKLEGADISSGFPKGQVSNFKVVMETCSTAEAGAGIPATTTEEFSRLRTLEWIAMPSSKGSSQPRDRSQVSHIAGKFFTD